MEKEFVLKNESLELKELGFSEKCIAKYQKLSEGANYQFQWLKCPQNSNVLDNAISSPTFSQAFRFFREKYNMYVIISYYGKNQYFIELLDYKGNQLVQIKDNTFWTYEEAELECLKQLIKICKEQNT